MLRKNCILDVLSILVSVYINDISIYILLHTYTRLQMHIYIYIYLNSMIPWQDEISSPSGDFSYALLKNHPFSSMIFPFLHFHWMATPDFHIFSNDIPIQTARVVNSHIIFQQFFRLTFPWKLHFRPAASCASPETRWASAGCCDPHGTAKQRGRTIMGWSYGENSAKIATLEMFKP